MIAESKTRTEEVEMSTKVDSIMWEENKKEDHNESKRGDLFKNSKGIEKKISKEKINTTKMKEIKDFQAIKIIEEKTREFRIKDMKENKELSSKKMRSPKKEEMITKMKSDHSIGRPGISEISGKGRANRGNIKNIKRVTNLKVEDTMMSVTISEDNKNGFKKLWKRMRNIKKIKNMVNFIAKMMVPKREIINISLWVARTRTEKKTIEIQVHPRGVQIIAIKRRKNIESLTTTNVKITIKNHTQTVMITVTTECLWCLCQIGEFIIYLLPRCTLIFERSNGNVNVLVDQLNA